MRAFTCGVCGLRLYFESVVCERCGSPSGFLPEILALITLRAEDDAFLSDDAPGRLRYCANYATAACNWLVPADAPDALCTACRLNRIIPDISDDVKLRLWQKIQQAKARLIYSLLRLRLPFDDEGGAAPMAFNTLAEDGLAPGGTPLMTGHSNGLITLNLAEAHDAAREDRRLSLGERYRTLLGHFRHESGHYYWDRLVRDTPHIEAFRALFGDERRDYAQALQQYYAAPREADRQSGFISPYAGAHPWEDWAETWAHYLHIVDTLDTACARGFIIGNGSEPVRGEVEPAGEVLTPQVDPYAIADDQWLLNAWLPLCEALNALNRSMGLPDLYPFILSPRAMEKLAFVHRFIERAKTAGPAPDSE